MAKAPTKAPKKTPAKKGNAADALEGVDASNGATTTETETKTASKAPVKLTAAARKKILAVPDLPKDAIAETCQAIESLKSNEALPLAQQLIDSNDYNEFKLGGILAVIDANAYWKESGAENFKSFIETEFNLQYRKAMYLMSIYNCLVESGVEWEQVKDLGWTKLKEICGKLTLENVETWVELARKSTTVQLIAEIKNRDGDGNLKEPKPDRDETDTPEVSTRTFQVHTEQKTTINDAVAKARDEVGTEHDNTAITHICEQYLQGKLGKKATGAKAKPWKDQIKELHDKDEDTALETVIEFVAELYPELDFTVAPAEESEEEETEE
ncbi:hypothetical protein NVP1215B_102 [Vibrio phage 1.215.B._10N.222.54.F7]|nr:hypothetical protein NVP1215A_102 [Vibrio phage 1.215.A._10N.222.54.F7]AUR96125.1 hypothetical protein NVP1215B_102 [Vibrio phage 1.215.B._10N.222.54.F7]